MEGINNNRFHGLENFRSSKKTVTEQKESKEKESGKVKIAHDDPYMKWPLRGLAYTNELGEIIRPMNGLVANLLWVPAIGYIAADVADKYKHAPDGSHEPSKKRATKQLSFQMLASVILPTAAVKIGQKAANVISAKGKTKLSINDRADYTNMITESMNKGSHEVFVDAATGKVDRQRYTQHIVDNIAEKSKHKQTHKEMMNPLEKVINFIKKPFKTEPKTEHIHNYVAQTVDNIMDMRETLLEGKKPKNVSDKMFKSFKEATKSGDIVAKKSAAFNIIKKTQGSKLFKNNALKSLGGLVALGIMMKPIDNFVEHVLIEKCISPTIDWVGNKPWKSLPDKVKEENKTSAA